MPRDGAVIFADLIGNTYCMSTAPSAAALVAIKSGI
jgi:hypothetical protein